LSNREDGLTFSQTPALSGATLSHLSRSKPPIRLFVPNSLSHCWKREQVLRGGRLSRNVRARCQALKWMISRRKQLGWNRCPRKQPVCVQVPGTVADRKDELARSRALDLGLGSNNPNLVPARADDGRGRDGERYEQRCVRVGGPDQDPNPQPSGPQL
jgi:hypothetical protein